MLALSLISLQGLCLSIAEMTFSFNNYLWILFAVLNPLLTVAYYEVRKREEGLQKPNAVVARRQK